MPAELQPWREIQDDPDFLALPAEKKARVYDGWKGEFAAIAKQEGAGEDELAGALTTLDNTYGARLTQLTAGVAMDAMRQPFMADWSDTMPAPDPRQQQAELGQMAAITALDVTTAPYRQDWYDALTPAERDSQRAGAMIERDEARAARPAAMAALPRFARGDAVDDREQAVQAINEGVEAKERRFNAMTKRAAPDAAPPGFPSFEEWMRAQPDDDKPGGFATGMSQLSSSLMGQVSAAMRAVAPSFGGNWLNASNELAKKSKQERFFASLNENASGDIGRGVGSVVSLLAGTPGGKVGALTAALRAAGDAHTTVLTETGSETQANTAAAHTFPAMLAYIVAGGLAARGAAKLMGAEASALKQGVVGGAAATGANVATSGLLTKLEGGEYGLQNLTQDALFGIIHGVGNFKNASAELHQRAADELARRAEDYEADQTLAARDAANEQQRNLRGQNATSPFTLPGAPREAVPGVEFPMAVGRPAGEPLVPAADMGITPADIVPLTVAEKVAVVALTGLDSAPSPAPVEAPGAPLRTPAERAAAEAAAEAAEAPAILVKKADRAAKNTRDWPKSEPPAGYETVFMPYGPEGKGYYHAPIREAPAGEAQKPGELISGDAIKTPEQLAAEAAAAAAAKLKLQQAQDVRLGAARALEGTDAPRPERDMFAAEKEAADLFDRKSEQAERDSAEAEAGEGGLLTRTDMEARQEIAREKYEAEQLAEVRAFEETHGNELLASIKQLGGLPVLANEPVLKGEVKRLWQTAKGKGGAMQLFRASQKMGLDKLRGSLEAMGFKFDTPNEFLETVERAMNGERIIGYERAMEGGREESARNLGPGAANIEEPITARPIGSKNASVDAQRAERGLPPLMSEARKSDPALWAEAERRIEENPEWPSQIVEDIHEGMKESVSDTERMAILHRMIDLRNKRDLESVRSKDTNLTPEQQQEHLDNFALFENALARTEEAARRGGSYAGAALRAIRIMANEDFTLAPMEARERKAKLDATGESLTPDEVTKIKTEADEIAELSREMDAKREQQEAAERLAAAEASLSAAAKFHPKVLEYAESVVSRWESAAIAARKELREALGMVSANPFQTKVVTALFKIARAKIARGSLNAAEFGTEMLADFGTKVKDLIQPAWDKAMKFIGALDASKTRKKTPKEKEREKIAGEDVLSTEDGIRGMAEKGELPDDMGRFVKMLANDYVKAGASTVDAVVAKLHAFLDPIIPGMSDRQLLDLWTDYGKGKEATKDPTKMLQQQIRGEALLTDQILALEAGETKLGLTGQQRVANRAEARKLREKLNELKKKLPVPEGDPAKRLQTTLDTMEKRARNRIADLRFEIAKGERTIKQRGIAPTSPTLDALRAELATVEAEHLAVFGKREATPEQKLKSAIAAAERAEAAAAKELADAKKGIFAKPAKKGVSRFAEVDAIRARTEAARAETAALKLLADPPLSPAQKALDAALVAKERWQQMLAGESNPAKRLSKEALTELENDARLEIAAMRELAAEIRHDARPKTDPEIAKENAAVKALEKATAEYERRLNAADFGARGRPHGPPTARVAAAQALRDAAKAAFDAAKDVAKPKRTPEEIAIATRKAAMTRQIADIADRIARGDFAPRTKKPPTDISGDPEAVRIEAALQAAKADFAKRQFDWMFARRGIGKRIGDAINTSLDTFQGIAASFDVSAVGRQLLGAGAARPMVVLNNLSTMFGGAKGDALWRKIGLTSEAKLREIEAQIALRPNAALYARDKLALTRYDALGVEGHEEAFRGRIVRKIPGVAGSGRAFMAILNKTRADLYDMYAATMSRTGTPTAAEGREIANFVNSLTGRADMGKTGDNAAVLLNRIFWSPRLLVSRVKTLLLYHPIRALATGNAKMAGKMAYEQSRQIVAVALVYGALKALLKDDVKIEDDPRSKEFGKLKIGKRVIDIAGGFIQPVVLSSTVISGKYKTGAGELVAARTTDEEDVKFGKRQVTGHVGAFLRSKLHPAPGLIFDLSDGENVIGERALARPLAGLAGEEPSKIGYTLQSVLPLSIRDVKKNMQEEGWLKGTALTMLNMLGVSSYRKNEGGAALAPLAEKAPLAPLAPRAK